MEIPDEIEDMARALAIEGAIKIGSRRVAQVARTRDRG
jgi:hypothetical protein